MDKRRGWFCMVLAVSIVGLCLAGCDDDAETATTDPASGGTDVVAPTEPPPVEPPAAEAGPLVEDPTFELRATATGPYHSGEAGQFGIRLTPKGEFHVNEEYPISVTLRGPDGIAFAKQELERADAAEFGARVARFDVPFTASATGEHRVECDVSFAVCTAENCVPDERTLAVLLPVE